MFLSPLILGCQHNHFWQKGTCAYLNNEKPSCRYPKQSDPERREAVVHPPITASHSPDPIKEISQILSPTRLKPQTHWPNYSLTLSTLPKSFNPQPYSNPQQLWKDLGMIIQYFREVSHILEARLQQSFFLVQGSGFRVSTFYVERAMYAKKAVVW